MRALLLMLTGCSSVLGIDSLEGPSPAPADVSPDVPVEVPATIRITGEVQHVTVNGDTSPVQGVQVELTETVGASANPVVTDNAGRFEIVIDTGGSPVEGALITSNVAIARPTEQFFLQPLIADTSITLQTFDDEFWQMASAPCGGNFNPQLPVVVAFLVDSAGEPVENAPIESSPGVKWCGQDMTGGIVPEHTGVGGFAFAFMLPPGLVQIRSGAAMRTFNAPAATQIFVGLTL